MKVTIYFPDGTTTVYTLNSGGVTEMVVHPNGTGITIKFDNKANNISYYQLGLKVEQK